MGQRKTPSASCFTDLKSSIAPYMVEWFDRMVEERKLNNSDMAKIPTEAELEQYKEGAVFGGWTSDYGETIFDIDDLSTTTFDKNVELYPVWKTKINFDAI